MTLQEFQKLLLKTRYDAYIVTRGNMFLGADILPAENKIRELTGFSGSAGTLLVFRNRAVLLVDGRYKLQASMEVDTNAVEVICTQESTGRWIAARLQQPLTIAFDPWCHSAAEVESWHRDLPDHTFEEDRKQLLGPRLGAEAVEIFEHPVEFSGISMNEKLSYLTEFMQKNNLDACLITEADAVSWLMNLRSHALPETPLLRAYALIDRNSEISLFTNDFSLLEKELTAYKNRRVAYNPKTAPRRLQSLMKERRLRAIPMPLPLQDWKAVKNPVELSGFIQAHLRDGAALVRFLIWYENNWRHTDECALAQKLLELRRPGEHFHSLSFATIAASGPNGAIVHYQPTAASNRPIESDSVLLLDSGAHYADGTTDITRTLAAGNPPAEVTESYTQVLKAHIAAASALFPAGTPGSVIDSLARAQLWYYGKYYEHGTGHGVGHFLNVHEGPQRLAAHAGTYPLAANMVTSIEPGYYRPGSYGIRIENLYYIMPAQIPDQTTPMLKFEPLTMVPLDKRLINKYLLTARETEWLNNYHAKVRDALKPLLSAEEFAWLQQACAPL